MERVEIIGAAAAVGVVAALVGLGVVLLALRRDPPPPVRGLLRAVALSLAAALLAHVLLLTRLPAEWTQVLVGIAAAAITLGAVIVAWTAVSRPAAPLADAVEPVDDGRVRELEEINRRFELALSSANVTVFGQDADLRYAWLHNPRPGLTAAAAGEPMPGTEPPGAVALKREVLATGETRTGGVVVALRDGGVHHFDLTFVPTRDADGAVDGLLGTAVDVTERRLLDVRMATMAAQAAAAYRRFDLALEDFDDHGVRAGCRAALHLHAQPAARDQARGLPRPDRRRGVRRARPRQALGAEAARGRERRARGGGARSGDRGRASVLCAAGRREDRRVGRHRGGDRHRRGPDRATAPRAEPEGRDARAHAPVEEPAGGGAGDGAEDGERGARHRDLRPGLLVAASRHRRGARPARRRVRGRARTCAACWRPACRRASTPRDRGCASRGPT